MLKSILRRAIAALGLGVLFVGAPATAKAPQAARPALWKVSDADTTIYLFGTIHLLPDNYQWRTPKFDRAVEESQGLVVETIVDLAHPEAFAATFAQMGMSPTPLTPILDRVKPAKREALKAAIAKTGAAPTQLSNLETWALGFQLLSVQFAALGLNGKDGPEAILRQRFGEEHKPVDQLETLQQQLSFFDTLSEPAQRDFLEGSLEDLSVVRKEFAQMLTSWSRGDVRGMAAAFNSDLSGSPELSEVLMARRNANWSKWIEARMDKPGTIMVAVGAGHLAGAKSVIAMLQRDGYRVKRVQ